ncbi:MAG: hypothetical protein AAGC67_06880 [Myxococcota bacterium]
MARRFLPAFLIAIVVAFLVFWVGARLANIVSGPHTELNEFTRGRKMMLCGRVVDQRHELSDYDFDAYQGSRCDNLSALDECLLDCLSVAGTVAMGEACYADCVLE